MPTRGQIRSHSRSSSATRLGPNLQITHNVNKHKKTDHHNKAPPGLQHTSVKPLTSSKYNGNPKPAAGFTLSHQGNDDEDDWVSTESGAASPDHSDDEADAISLQERLQRIQLLNERPETPRPHAEKPPAAPAPGRERAPPQADLPPSPPSFRQDRKRRSRPPSMHSLNSRTEPALRPHHLSYIPKQGPLAPLAVIPDAATADAATATHHDGDNLTTSPSSIASSDPALRRRSSVSSARSVSTVPVFHTNEASSRHERNRTLSTIPTSSSSAALSSLTHLPAVTRPPSPQPIVFFPPQNPHANIDNIHPLLPSPYMSNHMTVLSRRTPLRESYDRVMRAKLAAAR